MAALSRKALVLLVPLSFISGCENVTVLHTEADAPVAQERIVVRDRPTCEAEQSVGALEIAGGVLLALASIVSHSHHHSGRALGHALGLTAHGVARTAACSE